MNKVDHQNEHFGAISNEYFNARQNSNHLLYKHLLFSYVFHYMKKFKKTKLLVLEPMCGYGEGKEIIEKYTGKSIIYEGFDYSDVLIEKVKNKTPDINIYKQDVTTFKSNKSYDIIILLGGLHHVPDFTDEILRNLHTSLNRGGIFINFEPTSNNSLYRWIRKKIYNKNHIFDEKTEHDFSLNELNKYYCKNDFKICKQFYPGLLSYILYYNPDAFPFLNIGGKRTVKFIFNIDKLFYQNIIGKVFSFCTLSFLEKKK